MDWAPWAYQYGVGLILLLLGVWAGFKNGVWSSDNKRWLVIVVVGWLTMLTLHGLFQYWGTS